MLFEDTQNPDSSWQAIAEDLGLTYENNGQPALFGKWQSQLVNVNVSRETRGGTSQFYTEFEVWNDHDFNTSFHLTRQQLIQNLAEMVGSKDIQIGNYRFDSTALIKGWNEEVIQFVFRNESVRAACQKMFNKKHYLDIEITHQNISISVAGKIMAPAVIGATLSELANVNSLLKSADREYDRLSKPPEPEVEEIVEQVVVEEAPPEIPEEPKPEPVVPSPPPIAESGLSLSEVRRKLLSEGYTKDRFNNEFRGQAVEWHCELSHIIPANELSGWVATFDLSGLELEYKIGRQRKEAFDNLPGTEMNIQGVITDFDPDASTLYIDSTDELQQEQTYSATVLVNY